MSFRRSKKIYIITDDTQISSALSAYLSKDNDDQIHIFDAGDKALEAIHQVVPDVIVLSYHLNHHTEHALNGIQTMEEIRKKHSNIHFIVLSSQESYGIALQSLTHGAEHYIVKDDEHAFKDIAAIITEIQ